jgi:hypothetical protein
MSPTRVKDFWRDRMTTEPD